MASIWETLLSIGGDVGSAFLNNQAAQQSSDQLANAATAGQNISRDAVAQGRSDVLDTSIPGVTDIATGIQGGVNALEAVGPAEQMAKALSGALGPEAMQQAIDGFVASPGQDFIREQGEQAITRNSAAIGGLGGGLVRQELQKQGQGLAATNMQQFLQNLVQQSIPESNRSTNVSNLLSSGGLNLANFRSGIGTRLANLAVGGASQQVPLSTDIGTARAAGTLGSNTALQQGLSGISRTLGEFVG
jgi:hypothetical protein